MPYKCLNCGCSFEEPIIIPTTYESYYGVDHMFSYSTPLDLSVCPNCEDEEIEEVNEFEDEEEEEDGNQ